ncbi:MAG TPA: class I SAM-dependent methyltransferase [Actinomycetota bacterium]|nr:class I SAM-dependent methyltransferase [Actinomycetota bacterium]
MTRHLDDAELAGENEERRRVWAKQAGRYDKSIAFFERRVFGPGHREWACSHASGRTLEVAVGSGLNIPLYDPSVQLTAVDLSPEMLELARARAAAAGRKVALLEGDAHALAFPDGAFETVVCTYSLCNIPDPHRAVGEMKRVLGPGGRLVLVDHVRSPVKPVLWVQKAIELLTRRFEGEHMTRRPLEQVRAHGLDVVERERLGLAGIVERVVALKPG